MPINLTIKDSKKTRTRKVSSLPRIGVSVDIGGKQISLKYVPLIETMMNLKGKKINWKNIIKVYDEQIKEVFSSSFTVARPKKAEKSKVPPKKRTVNPLYAAKSK